MNILFLSCWYPTKETPLKGIFIKAHAHAIHLAGERIMVLALDVASGNSLYEKQIEKFKDEAGVETHLIKIKSVFYKWIYANPFHIHSVIKKYFEKEILPSFNPDVIHSNILNPCAIIGSWIAAKHNKPHVITEHWSKIDKYMRKNIFSFYGRKAYQNAKAITVVSDFLKKDILKYVKDISKIKIVPNVVDTHTFSYRPKIKSERIIFTAIASWKPPKQPMLFIEALNKIGNERIILNMVGEGPQLDAIKKMKLNFHVRFHQNIPRQKIAAMLQESDFFLHASHIETFSLVIAEALCTGTPVIASDVGAIPELVNDTNGVLCSNNVKEWENAIKTAMKTNYDNQKISENVITGFSMEKISTLFSEIYK